jgi:hypothetical protein
VCRRSQLWKTIYQKGNQIMTKTVFKSMALAVAMLSLALVQSAYAGPPEDNMNAPNFSPVIYGDGELWGTKVVTTLPAPNGHNDQSFDKFFVVTNGVGGQMPVAEAAPTNPDYNGGRWATYTVIWNVAPEELTSYEDIAFHQGEGNLTVVAGSPAGGPPPYFECPLLPVYIGN